MWFSNYNNRDADTAARIIDLLNSGRGAEINLVGVTFEASEDDEFYQTIRNAVLDDGRPADAVIVDWPGHTGHFHIRK